MTCNIQLRYVNLVKAPPGQTSFVRVMGEAIGCPSPYVHVKTSVTGQTQNPVHVNPFNDRFVADLPLTSLGAQCGDTITVDVWCLPQVDGQGNPLPPACQISVSETLECCSVTITSVTGMVPSGSFEPTQIAVSGLALGCFGDQVVAQVPGVAGQSLPTSIDPVTGAFNVVLQVTGTVNCDERITVRAWCASDPTNCFDEPNRRLGETGVEAFPGW